MSVSDPKILDLDYASFQEKPELQRHIASEAFCALAKRPGRELLVDCTAERRSMKAGFVLALSWAFSRRLKQLTNRQRVGIVFPPGIGGYLANLAVVFAGKVPVNLNFTLSPSTSEACLRRAGIDCVLSTQRVQVKVPEFPWSACQVVDVVDELKQLPKLKVLSLLLAVYWLPAKLLAGILKVPRVGGDQEAALLFTSGSSGEPKGVVLTHRNLLGNCLQIDSSGLLPSHEKLLANLPIFHSFGFTVSLWYPLLRGCGVVTVPSPLEVKKTAETIQAEAATVLLGTPTFYRAYFKYASPEQLKSLKYVVAGAEKTPDGFAERWESTFGSRYLEGYGLTETAPVTSVNLPRKPMGVDYPGDSDDGNRARSVGRLLPGMSARVVHPESGAELPLTETGLLLLRGPNIFSHYLDDPERSAEVKVDEWFMTGDLARLDADGFLYIEGRLSRFSKIGGEMVPHGTVEAVLNEAFGLEDAEFPLLAIGGRPDAAKGESLVLLAAMPLELDAVREVLKSRGLPNLWVPKSIVRLNAIPLLATGKLDLKAIQEIASSDVSSSE